MLSQWLDATLDGVPLTSPSGTFEGVHWHIPLPGVLALIPIGPGPNAHACIFSAAIHGNETAPVELLGQWLSALEAGVVSLGAPVLVILGNMPALRLQKRFVETNLNRLFKRDLTQQGDEPDRARELMAAVDAFFAEHPSMPRLHFDLHTAIRTSLYPRFVVEPFSDTPGAKPQWGWLAGAGMQAVLHQHQHSFTFSHYSKHYHQAQAFTFELGQVAPFGQNDLTPLAPMYRLIAALGAGQPPATADQNAMTFFKVAVELMRESQAFTLCFDEQTPNFTRFEPGTCLAQDARGGDFTVEKQPLHVVFPNANVEVGARAALLVAPV